MDNFTPVVAVLDTELHAATFWDVAGKFGYQCVDYGIYRIEADIRDGAKFFAFEVNSGINHCFLGDSEDLVLSIFNIFRYSLLTALVAEEYNLHYSYPS